MSNIKYYAVPWPEYQEYLENREELYYCADYDLYFVPEYLILGCTSSNIENISPGTLCVVWDNKAPENKKIKRYAFPGYCFDSVDSEKTYPWDHIIPLTIFETLEGK